MAYSYEKSKDTKKKTYSYEKDNMKAQQVKRKPYSYERDLSREEKAKLKRSVKKLSLTWIIVLIFLALGVVGGFFAHKYAFPNDTYQMVAYSNGSIDITIGAEEEHKTYTELGVKCITFGKDISSECTVKYYFRTDLSQEQVEVSKVDETVPGMYYAVYTTTSSKYKTVTLIRNIMVLGEEDNG